jgi:CBS domain-containing protein
MQEGVRMPSIRDVMTSHPKALPSTASVVDAAEAMRQSDIGDVIVLDETDQICGIVTDRDIVVRAIAEKKDPSDVRLGDICSRSPITLTPQDEVGDAVKLMTQNAIRRLPIVEEGVPVGVVSLGDLAMTKDPGSGLGDISSAPPNE